MVYIDLIFNLSLVVAITLLSGWIEKSWRRQTVRGMLANGVLFGLAAILSMSKPVILGEGMFFDGRPVIISVCALVFGPWAGIVTSLMAGGYRFWIGGCGVIAGLLVIVISFLTGAIGHGILSRRQQLPSVLWLFVFGCSINFSLLLMLLAMGGNGPNIVANIWLPVLLVYPLAIVISGKILADQAGVIRSLAAFKETKQNFDVTLKSIGDAVISTDLNGQITFMNLAAEQYTGWSQADALGQNLSNIFCVIHEKSRKRLNDPVEEILSRKEVVDLGHCLLVAKDGSERPISDSAAPILSEKDEITGVVLVFRDQSEDRRNQRIQDIRLTLVEYSIDHSLAELLQKALDEIGDMVKSPIGFYHFVEKDGKTLSLQQWSTQTLQTFCHTDAFGKHYNIDQAGVWVDCIEKKGPVVHNDYDSLPHKKGMPEGHARVIRELVVPIIRGSRVVAILGVGNKPTDYTDKDVETVSYLADVVWQIVDKKRMEEDLKESEHRYRNLIELAPIGIFSTMSCGKVLSINSAMARIVGLESPDDAVGDHGDIAKDFYVDPKKRAEFIQELMDNGRLENKEFMVRTATDRQIWLRISSRVARKNEDGSSVIEGFATDITSQKRMEEQFRQAQKMESVGRLAGGVAHDYNNMLSVILGYTELALIKAGDNESLLNDLRQIHHAASRSTDVTRQLLAFARKQAITPKVIQMNETVEGALKMLRRLIGEDINLTWLPGETRWPVNMDPSQIDQILANLCVNARDAIIGTGKITIETGRTVFDEAYCKNHAGFYPGDFVMLAVSDNGEGMDKDTQANLFEPFFTTKDVGKGTGLGLATIYGIVKQNKGFINVYSELGSGTTIRVYVPSHMTSEPELLTTSGEPIVMGQGETVLLVEDEPAILSMGTLLLEKLRYEVLAAGTVSTALELAKDHAGDIQLLITDVIMPDMDGRMLSDKLKGMIPGLKCLFMSGYTANVIAQHGVLDEGMHFIQKPFSLDEFARLARKALDS